MASSVHRLPVKLMPLEHAERKRAQDRINQRYSRARRKSKIEELESQNKFLSEKLAEAESEIARLRDRESAVRKVLGDTTVSLPVSPPIEQDGGNPGGSVIAISPTTGSSYANNSPPSLPSTNDILPDAAGVEPPFPFTFPPTDFPTNCGLDLDFGSDPAFGILATSCLGQNASPWSTFDIVPQLSNFSPDTPLYKQDGVPDWQALPLHLPPATLLDEVVLKTAESGRQWTRRTGRQHSELSQPSFPSISSLLNPNSQEEAENPIASAVSAQVRRTTVTSFTARVAFHYKVAVVLRWYVAPSEETYRQLPENMKPTKLQRTVAHQAWIDLFCWPEGRDAIIKHMDQSEFEEFRYLTSSTLDIHWPYSDADVFLSSTDGKQVILNPIFISHIRDCRNWTVGEEVARKFPFMKGIPTVQGQCYGEGS